jgi:hypothetical protein
MHRMIFTLLAMLLLNSLEAVSQASFSQNPDSIRKPVSIRILPQKFYTTTLPYSCKQEILLQNLIRLPLFIRLGSKEQVDYLEGKNRHFFVGLASRPANQKP